MAIGGIGELEIEVPRIFFGLLESVGRMFVFLLSLHDSQEKIASVAKQIVNALGVLSKAGLAPRDDAPLGVGTLLRELIIKPANRIEFRQNERPACIRFGGHL